ncbi:MAG: hypothetical protein ACXWG1_12930 [Usitatibacter sp.]
MRKTRNLMVYRYEYWDVSNACVRISDTYATLDAIMKGMGIPLLHTGKVMPRAEIFHEWLPNLAV